MAVTSSEDKAAPGFLQSTMGRNILLLAGAALAMAVMAGVWMWSKQPEYRVLFSNFSDRDGGAIVAALQQMNVPYKFAEGGGAILVPATQVHDARLKLASQGLPKGGGVGFELMENQKLGVSQFLEQVNFQRALEGELARSVQAIAAVQAARVHLALPKSSLFVREQQKPTASVLLNLHPGRGLDAQQISAIVHLVASSVPDLPPTNVTIVDQAGNFLSQNNKAGGQKGLDPNQLKYVQELQDSIARRVESIITPIVGPNNVRAEATADVDFSQSEQAAETYKPNQQPDAIAIRSQQTSEATSAAAGAGGVPGALSNQPPVPATAPLTQPGQPGAPATAASAGPSQKETTTNYEVDKTVRYVQQPMGGIKRLSVAVVVNYKKDVDKEGKPVLRPLTDEEKTQITDLVREAMGFNKDRGDSLNVVNSSFAQVTPEPVPEIPLWKNPAVWDMAMYYGKYFLGILLCLILFFKVVKPMLTRVASSVMPAETSSREPSDGNSGGNDNKAMTPEQMYEANIELARMLAKDNPRVVANVVKTWVNGNE